MSSVDPAALAAAATAAAATAAAATAAASTSQTDTHPPATSTQQSNSTNPDLKEADVWDAAQKHEQDLAAELQKLVDDDTLMDGPLGAKLLATAQKFSSLSATIRNLKRKREDDRPSPSTEAFSQVVDMAIGSMERMSGQLSAEKKLAIRKEPSAIVVLAPHLLELEARLRERDRSRHSLSVTHGGTPGAIPEGLNRASATWNAKNMADARAEARASLSSALGGRYTDSGASATRQIPIPTGQASATVPMPAPAAGATPASNMPPPPTKTTQRSAKDILAGVTEAQVQSLRASSQAPAM